MKVPLPPNRGSHHLYVNVLAFVGRHVEVDDLRAQACLHLGIHLVASFHQLLGQLHVLLGQTVVGTKRQRSWQEADQVVLREEEGMSCEITAAILQLPKAQLKTNDSTC